MTMTESGRGWKGRIVPRPNFTSRASRKKRDVHAALKHTKAAVLYCKLSGTADFVRLMFLHGTFFCSTEPQLRPGVIL